MDLPLDSVLGSIPADDLALSPDPVTVPEGQGSAPAKHTFCTDTLVVNSESPRQIDPVELLKIKEALDLILSIKITNDPTSTHAQIGLKAGHG